MQVSVETLNGLERKLTVSVPTEKIEEEVNLRLRKLSQRVKVDGFRPGKVPKNTVKSRYSDSVREEVAREMIQPTLQEALQTNALNPAGFPVVDVNPLKAGDNFTYTATFEIFPTFKINELNATTIEVINASVNEDDVDQMLIKLREQNQQWDEVSRPVTKGDKVVIDFEGFIDDKPFNGGSNTNHELIIGSGNMIPGFEDSLIGADVETPFNINVTFPENYGDTTLSGKEATFNITIKKIMAGTLPELDDDFVKKFNIKEGGVDALRKDIKQNMVRELDRRVSALNREYVFNKLLAVNKFDLPKALIDQEIEHLKHDMYHRLFGNEHSENEKIPDFPRELFEEQAARRVHLGLLFSEYVKVHELVADNNRVEAMIETFASAYEDPDELRKWYRESKENMSEVEALVMEEMVTEKIREQAVIHEKELSYDEVMNSKKGVEATGE